MGDRGNIAIRQRNGDHVVIYTHWSGSSIRGILQQALKRKLRWQDESYLARIIFQAVVGDDMGELGYGIAANYLPDNQHPVLVVDVPGQRVMEIPAETWQGTVPSREWAFDEFIALGTAVIMA